MPKRYRPEDIDAILKEMREAAPRSAILIGAALLEHSLTDALQNSLRQPENAQERQYFLGERQILSDFSEKIWAAYFLNLIGPKTRQDIDCVREIRNECAHNMNPLTFDTPSIADRCRQLRIGSQSTGALETPKNFRVMFMTTVTIITGALLVKSAAPIVKEAADLDIIKELDA
jgi:hypothetical protein